MPDQVRDKVNEVWILFFESTESMQEILNQVQDDEYLMSISHEICGRKYYRPQCGVWIPDQVRDDCVVRELRGAAPVEAVAVHPVAWDHGVVGISEGVDGGVGSDHL